MDPIELAGLIASILNEGAESAILIVNGVVIDVLGRWLFDALRPRR